MISISLWELLSWCWVLPNKITNADRVIAQQDRWCSFCHAAPPFLASFPPSFWFPPFRLLLFYCSCMLLMPCEKIMLSSCWSKMSFMSFYQGMILFQNSLPYSFLFVFVIMWQIIALTLSCCVFSLESLTFFGRYQ